ncbi:helix-turn-helix transcriptional regulator [Streptomyces griseoluteus]|uniref:helix-turn-helix domain-containing protein n=1 Tax=Streptomyces griseoluteus TaxID=29306 RepID=UPI0034269E1F
MPIDPSDEVWLREERVRVGRRIQEARVAGNLTQEAVFLGAALSRNYYQGIEAGRENPTLEVLLRIARAIGAPLSELLK